jgi:flagellar M-ring protein FliF
LPSDWGARCGKQRDRDRVRVLAVKEFLDLLRSFGLARALAIVGVSAGVAVALFLTAGRIGGAPMGVLYADLELADAQRVMQTLDAQRTKYEFRETAGKITILAPRSELSSLKIALAGDGFVATGGAVGYEIFDKTDALGSTSFQQTINRLRALEGELARTIASIDGVRTARVHLVLPERELFARDKRPATASIVVDAPSGLDQRSVRAIVNLAASAVPDLEPGHVTVLDATGALLASGQDGGDPFASIGGVDERTTATEARIRKTVEDIVGPIVGRDNVRVQVAAEIDLNRVTETANIIDPDSQTVLSSTIIEDASDQNDPSLQRGVTVANALPDAAIVDPASASAATSTARRTEETTNYEMTRRVRNEVRELGGVRRLSVAVALNIPQSQSESGAFVAAPRSADELALIESLVRSAVGFDASRGDVVEIAEFAFRDAPATVAGESASASALAIRGPQAMRAFEIAGLLAVAIALAAFVLRPMMGRPKAAPAIAPGGAPQTAQSSIGLAIESHIDLAQVDGKVKASSLKKVADVVRTHTDESSQILKTWIREAS